MDMAKMTHTIIEAKNLISKTIMTANTEIEKHKL